MKKKQKTFDGMELTKTLYGTKPEPRTIVRHLGKGMFTTIEAGPNQSNMKELKTQIEARGRKIDRLLSLTIDHQ